MTKDLDLNNYTFNPMWYFVGSPAVPEVAILFDDTNIDTIEFMSDTPAHRTVYHFDTGIIGLAENGGDISPLIYPTVINTNVNVIWPSPENATIAVFDITGRLILNKRLIGGFQSIDTSSWSAGMTIIKITDMSFSYDQKMIKHWDRNYS